MMGEGEVCVAGLDGMVLAESESYRVVSGVVEEVYDVVVGRVG